MRGSALFQRGGGNHLFIFYFLQFLRFQPPDYPVAMVAALKEVETATCWSSDSKPQRERDVFSVQWSCSSQKWDHIPLLPFVSSLSLSFSPSVILSLTHLLLSLGPRQSAVVEVECFWLGDQKEETSELNNTREIVNREHLGKLALHKIVHELLGASLSCPCMDLILIN